MHGARHAGHAHGSAGPWRHHLQRIGGYIERVVPNEIAEEIRSGTFRSSTFSAKCGSTFSTKCSGTFSTKCSSTFGTKCGSTFGTKCSSTFNTEGSSTFSGNATQSSTAQAEGADSLHSEWC